MYAREVLGYRTTYRFRNFFDHIVNAQLVQLPLERRRMGLDGSQEIRPCGPIVLDVLYIVRECVCWYFCLPVTRRGV